EEVVHALRRKTGNPVTGAGVLRVVVRTPDGGHVAPLVLHTSRVDACSTALTFVDADVGARRVAALVGRNEIVDDILAAAASNGVVLTLDVHDCDCRAVIVS